MPSWCIGIACSNLGRRRAERADSLPLLPAKPAGGARLWVASAIFPRGIYCGADEDYFSRLLRLKASDVPGRTFPRVTGIPRRVV